jgi:Bacterial PH domain
MTPLALAVFANRPGAKHTDVVGISRPHSHHPRGQCRIGSSYLRRVMFRRGLLTRRGIDVPLARINSVEFRHGLADRMLRTGTLIVESASQDPLEFYDIPRVEQVHPLLYHEVFDTLGSEESDSRSSGRRRP